MYFPYNQITIFFTLLLVSQLLSPTIGRELQLEDGNKKSVNLIEHDHLVTNLPGQPDHVTFKHFAGYISVDDINGRDLFYWFYEATSHPELKPLVLWLNGGPGCSSVGYGATQEIGPFIVDSDGHGLKFNPFSWNIEANMLFLESPIGVGFSYSNTTTDYNALGDDFTAKDAYNFLHKWFVEFPSYKTRPFYIAGESYAGKYVPELAELIHDKNNDPLFHIELKGILMGNPETSQVEDWLGMVDYAWSHAVISDETHKIIGRSCDFTSDDPWQNQDCNVSVADLFKQYKEIDIYSLYTSTCIGDSARSDDKSHQFIFDRKSTMLPRVMGGYDPCLDDYARAFYNRPDVQKALHVSDGHLLKNWSICNYTIYDTWNWDDSRSSVLPIYRKLIAGGLRIWVYSGDTDGRVPVISTRYSIAALGLNITRPWRPWYHDKQVSGWVQEYEGLTFATFRGAGHAVPIFKPSESLAFFAAYLRGESPPSSR